MALGLSQIRHPDEPPDDCDRACGLCTWGSSGKETLSNSVASWMGSRIVNGHGRTLPRFFCSETSCKSRGVAERLTRHETLSLQCYLSKRGFIHRDLAVRNVLLVGDVAKLSDFGRSRRLASVDDIYAAGNSLVPVSPITPPSSP